MKLRSVLSASSLLLSAVAMSACPAPLEGGGGGATGPGLAQPSHKAGSGEPIAKIGDVTLTTGDLEERLNKQSPFVRARYTTPERKKEFLENQVRFEVLAKEAFRRGYHQDPEVVESIKKIVVQKLTREEFDGRVNLKDITDDEIKAYYEAHTDDYNKPEMVRSSHIFFAFGDDKAAAKAKAEEAQQKAADPGKLADREAFKTLVAEYSDDDSTKRTGGDLRYLSAAELEQRFGAGAKDALWGTEDINDVTAVVEGKDGWHIFKRTGRRKPIERSLQQVRNQIRNVLYREKRTEAFQAFVDELQKELGVETFPERVDQVKVQPGPAPTPGMPGGGGHPHGMGAPGAPGAPGADGDPR